MGSKAIEINRSLVKDQKVSEMDVIIGLERNEDALNLYLDSVFAGNEIPVEMKEKFSKKLKTLLHSKSRKQIGDNHNLDSILISLKQNYSLFIFDCQVNKDNTMNIAYQFLKGEIEIEKAHKIKNGSIVAGSVEQLSSDETKKIIREYLGLNDESYLKKAIEDEKKSLSEE